MASMLIKIYLTVVFFSVVLFLISGLKISKFSLLQIKFPTKKEKIQYYILHNLYHFSKIGLIICWGFGMLIIIVVIWIYL